MHITDRTGMHYSLGITDKITVDHHLVSRLTKYGNSLTLHGFTIPSDMQGKGVGTQIVHQLERHAKQRGVTDLRVHLTEKDCAVHHAFWSKLGFVHTGTTFHKNVQALP